MDETQNTTPNEPSRENPHEHEAPKAETPKGEPPKAKPHKTEAPKTENAETTAEEHAAILRGGTSRYPRSMARLHYLAHGR